MRSDEIYATAMKAHFARASGRTIVSHSLKIDPHQIGQQEGIPPRIPGPIPNMEGIRGVCTAPCS